MIDFSRIQSICARLLGVIRDSFDVFLGCAWRGSTKVGRSRLAALNAAHPGLKDSHLGAYDIGTGSGIGGAVLPLLLLDWEGERCGLGEAIFFALVY